MKKMFFSAIALVAFTVTGFGYNKYQTSTSYIQLKFEQPENVVLCGVRVVTTYYDNDGNILGSTSENVWLTHLYSQSSASCQDLIRSYAKSINATIH